jgi:hypothetical protein
MDESRREFLGRLFGRQSLRALGNLAGEGLGVARIVEQATLVTAEEAGLALGREHQAIAAARQARHMGQVENKIGGSVPVAGASASEPRNHKEGAK